MTNIQSTIQTVTPAIAQQMLETMQYERQRDVNQLRVDSYAEAMRDGRFVPYTQIRVAHMPSGPILLDGQHRLWAVILSGTTQLFDVLETNEADNESVAWTYGNLDIGQHRNAYALTRALDLPNDVGLTQTQVSKMWRCMTFLMAGAEMGRATTLRRQIPNSKLMVDLVRLYAPYVKPFFNLSHPSSIKDGLLRSPTLTLIMLTYRYALRKNDLSTANFWETVITDDGLGKDDARKLANRHLTTIRLSDNHNHKFNGSQRASANYSFRYLAGCYNAYFQDRTLSRVVIRDERAPAAIVGVPSDTRKWIER